MAAAVAVQFYYQKNLAMLLLRIPVLSNSYNKNMTRHSHASHLCLVLIAFNSLCRSSKRLHRASNSATKSEAVHVCAMHLRLAGRMGRVSKSARACDATRREGCEVQGLTYDE